MKANELRIGNLLLGSIYFDEEEARQDLGEDYSEQEEWKITEVEGIPHQFENCTAWTDEEYNRLKPIPLTEEWFVKFGAKLDDFEIDCFLISSLTCDYRFFKSTTIDNNVYWTCEKVLGNTCIEYVHQLQNLYFALTGEELELK